MEQYIGCDAHRRYSVFCVVDEHAEVVERRRVEHDPDAIRVYLSDFPPGTPVAVESLGSWYWLADEVEAAGCEPHLAHALEVKRRLGRQKTDRRDARGLAVLLRNGTLPEAWLADRATRDLRELPRGRMALCHHRVAVKNRILATLEKYHLRPGEVSDEFGVSGREALELAGERLPPEHRWSLHQQLRVLDLLEECIRDTEARLLATIAVTPDMRLLQTAPGLGPVLSVVIAAEIGDIARFPSPEQFAGYSGPVPDVQASGGKVRHGSLRSDCNHYLKWAFIEAANVVQLNHWRESWQEKHLVRVYKRVKDRRGGKAAVGAVARHLAEAVWWMLTKQEGYRDPCLVTQRPT